MVFSSITFLIYFLPVIILLYHLVPHKFKNGILLLTSIYFYSWGGPKFIFVILATTIVDFLLVKAMHQQKEKKKKTKFLVISLLINLGLLFYFKYCGFFIENFNAATGANIKWLAIVLPVGISFYTFESITYIVDVYRGIHAPLKNFWHYQTYILFFPKLIAGPIVRYHDIANQITNRESNYTSNFKISGFVLFCIGLAKKCILANTLGMQADAVFNLNINEIDTAAAWIGGIAYTFQIYFDFSGYSDMAIGLGRIFGFNLPENFNNPYTSASITEFWRRWHITLGAWMKNYLYIPLGGNKVSNSMLYRNLAIVFVLSGFWHGASWNFILWGVFHGAFLILDRLFLLNLLQKSSKIIAIPFTFIVVVCGWVLFRNENLETAIHCLKQMFAFNFIDGKFALNNDFIFMVVLASIFSFFAITNKTQNIQNIFYNVSFNNKYTWPLVISAIALYYISLSFISALNFNPFIYFRF
ncbi:MAG: MBOAT family protein [Bacteroidetes bacterium]|nr:MBOAT family protein [Bacteroidota bacterium]